MLAKGYTILGGWLAVMWAGSVLGKKTLIYFVIKARFGIKMCDTRKLTHTYLRQWLSLPSWTSTWFLLPRLVGHRNTIRCHICLWLHREVTDRPSRRSPFSALTPIRFPAGRRNTFVSLSLASLCSVFIKSLSVRGPHLVPCNISVVTAVVSGTEDGSSDVVQELHTALFRLETSQTASLHHLEV